jgi:hypothetical protein
MLLGRQKSLTTCRIAATPADVEPVPEMTSPISFVSISDVDVARLYVGLREGSPFKLNRLGPRMVGHGP